MAEIKLMLEGQELQNGQLELWIKILANVQASNDTIIDCLCEGNQEKADQYTDLFNERAKRYATIIFKCLYERRGKVDIDEILGK